jgi:hypothetical protein
MKGFNMHRFLSHIFLILFLCFPIYSQQIFYPDQYWQVEIKNGCYNVETVDINGDGHLDIISGNFNDTYVYFGGHLLDSDVDLVYKGRCLAITDFNGDGTPDMITMHFTSYDSSRSDYNGEILFYYGKKTSPYLFDTIPDYSIPLPTLYPYQEGFSQGTGKTGIRIGDLNKDGKMDLVISSAFWPYGGAPYGRIFIYMGNNVPSTNPDYTIDNYIRFFDQFASYFEVGDINGDGYDDLLVSQAVTTRTTPRVDSLHNLYIFYGSANPSFDINNPSIKYESHINNKQQTSDWFLRYFSIDDINGDGIKDLVVSTFQSTDIHYGRVGGIDTIPSLPIKLFDPLDSTNKGRGISQDIGDYNNDGYHDFILSGGGKTFWLILGGPKVGNKNPYGIRGLLDAQYFFPNRAVNVGDQTGDGVPDFVCCAFGGDYGHILMFIGNKYVVTDIKKEVEPTSGKTGILHVYPNPFNSQMKINYTIESIEHVILKLYNSLGQEIEQLKNETENPGFHEINFRNDKLPSGIYFLTINHGGETETTKIVLTK